MITWPSRARKRPAGAVSGWWCPAGPGLFPLSKYMPAPHDSTPSVASSSEVSTSCPRPVVTRAKQRELDALRREDPREQVRDRDADARRPDLVGAGEAHQPAHRLRDRVEAGPRRVGAVGAEARDAAHHETRVAPQQLGGREAERGEHARAEVLHQHVRALEQSREHVSSRRLLHVERERALAAIGGQEEVVVARRPAPGDSRPRGDSIEITSAP